MALEDGSRCAEGIDQSRVGRCQGCEAHAQRSVVDCQLSVARAKGEAKRIEGDVRDERADLEARTGLGLAEASGHAWPVPGDDGLRAIVDGPAFAEHAHPKQVRRQGRHLDRGGAAAQAHRGVVR